MAGGEGVVVEVERDASDAEARVVVAADDPDRLQQLGDAVEREPAGVGDDEDSVGGGQRADREHAEAGRTVDQHDVVPSDGGEGVVEVVLVGEPACLLLCGERDFAGRDVEAER